MGALPWFDGFDAGDFNVNDIRLHARIGGRSDAPPLLLLHGFPQTHALWHRVAQTLAPHFRLVLPDLRGYGRSDKPRGEADHANYSKRTMAADLVALMHALGHERFGVAGHDRGGRVAHRLALDHAGAVEKLCVIDIAPTFDMYAATDMRFASAYYHWFHLIQPHPLPETMIGGCAKDYLHAKLGGWGGGGTAFIEPEAVADYEACFCRREAIHAACEDYRASAGIDLEHDRASRAAGQQIIKAEPVATGETTHREGTSPLSGRHQLTHLASLDAVDPAAELVGLQQGLTHGSRAQPNGLQQIRGQIEGAVVQAAGYTILENFIQKDGYVHTPHLSTYLIPTVLDIPEHVESMILEYPDPVGPWGARGMAEMPFLPVAPAVIAAVHDATGVWFHEFPLTPERVLLGLGIITSQ